MGRRYREQPHRPRNVTRCRFGCKKEIIFNGPIDLRGNCPHCGERLLPLPENECTPSMAKKYYPYHRREVNFRYLTTEEIAAKRALKAREQHLDDSGLHGGEDVGFGGNHPDLADGNAADPQRGRGNPGEGLLHPPRPPLEEQ
jgi:hypothetical protein